MGNYFLGKTVWKKLWELNSWKRCSSDTLFAKPKLLTNVEKESLEQYKFFFSISFPLVKKNLELQKENWAFIFKMEESLNFRLCLPLFLEVAGNIFIQIRRVKKYRQLKWNIIAGEDMRLISLVLPLTQPWRERSGNNLSFGCFGALTSLCTDGNTFLKSDWLSVYPQHLLKIEFVLKYNFGLVYFHTPNKNGSRMQLRLKKSIWKMELAFKF